MILIVKQKQTGQLYQVTQFNATEDVTVIWAAGWPGVHTIGHDCEWEKIAEDKWQWICFIRENPELSMKQLAKELDVDMTWICRFVKKYGLAVRMERTRGEMKTPRYFKK